MADVLSQAEIDGLLGVLDGIGHSQEDGGQGQGTWRQGDLLIRKIATIPKGATRREGLVLAEGEVTGHAHRLERGELFEIPGTGAEPAPIFFTVNIVTSLLHEEHGPIRFDPGCYEVVRQRQYDPIAPPRYTRVDD